MWGTEAGNTKGLREDLKGMWKNQVAVVRGNAGRATGGAGAGDFIQKAQRRDARTMSHMGRTTKMKGWEELAGKI